MAKKDLVKIGNVVKPTTGTESGIFSNDIRDMKDMGNLFQSSNIYNRYDIYWYDAFNRFGCVDPYNSLSHTKEYLFFTKPDLHIFEPGTQNINPELAGNSFFTELISRYPLVARQLQKSVMVQGSNGYNPFMPLLSNAVKNKMDMPEMTASVIDNSATIFGTSINYRGDAFNSNEKHEFSLEFEDTRYLEIYHFFRAYEEYEQLKKFGIITPPNINMMEADAAGYAHSQYIQNKELHDQYSIFKIIVDEDYEDIVYYGLAQGVFSKSTPREAFSDIDPNGGLRYTVQFEAQFVDDMKPYILTEFNELINSTMGLSKTPVWLDIYNSTLGEVDGRWAAAPYVVKQYRKDTQPKAWLAPKSMDYKYKLKWRLK